MSSWCLNISPFCTRPLKLEFIQTDRAFIQTFIYLKHCNLLPWQMHPCPTDLHPEWSTKWIFLTHLPILLHLCIVYARHSSYLQCIKPKLLTPTSKDTFFSDQPSFVEEYLLPFTGKYILLHDAYKTRMWATDVSNSSLLCWPVLSSFLVYRIIELLRLEETSKTILYHAISPFKHFEAGPFSLFYIILVLGPVPC